MSEDLIRVTNKILKLQKDVFLTMDIFFVNKISLFLTLSHKIDFTATSHLCTQKARDTFKSFWSIYVLYLRYGFQITTVHADRQFDLVRELISKISSGQMVNLMSANENVPKIVRQIRVVKERCRAIKHILT